MPVQDQIIEARQSGYSWDQINAHLAQKRAEASAAGYSDQEIDSYLGRAGDAQAAEARMTANARQGFQAGAPHIAGNWWEDFKAGVERSSGGLILHGQPTTIVDPKQAGFFGRLAASAGETVGDLPAMVAGAQAGAPVGAAAGALVPGAGETGVSEAVGGAAGGGFGAFALPQAIKDEYAEGLANGSYKGPDDFIHRQAKVLLDTAKWGAVGAGTSVAGLGAKGVLAASGASAGTQFAGKTAAELAAMTGLGSAVKGQLPTWEDATDAAILLLGFKAATHLSETQVKPIRDNLIRNWKDTGQKPTDAVTQAKIDPAFRAEILGSQPPEPPPASSQTAVPGEPPEKPFVLPRLNNASFSDSMKFIMPHEDHAGHGAVTVDSGGVTKWGISQKNNPDLDVKSLTRPQAEAIYYTRYWKPLGADNLPSGLRTAAMDAAVNEGVVKTKEMLAESGGDLQKFLSLRDAHYKSLIEADPQKYAAFAKSWSGRLRDLGYGGKPPEEPPESERTPPPEEGDPWKIVGSHIAEPDTGGPYDESWRDLTYRAYTDLFNPTHPISRLVRAAEKGEPIPDANNPEFLARIAENHNTHAMYAIERDAQDINGTVTGPGLKKIIAPFGTGDSLNRFWTFAAAKWSLEKAVQGKETGIEQHPAAQVVAEGEAKYGAAFGHLVDWQNTTLQWLKDGGILSAKQFDAMTAENKARIPGYRVQEDGKPSGGGAGRTAFNPIKSFTGSEKPIKNIYQSLAREAFLRSQLALYNRTNLALADLAAPLDLAGKVKGKALPIEISAQELAKQDIDSDGMDALIWRLARQPFAKDEVPILRDGKLERWTFSDPNIARVMRGWDQQTRTIFQKIAQPMTRFVRGMIVLNPLFPVRLMTYDVPWQFITKPGLRNPLADVFAGLGNTIGDTAGYDAWLRSGAAERVFDGLSKDAYIQKMMAAKADPTFASRVWNTAKTPYHALRTWAQLLNQAQRVGRFTRGQKAGESGPRLAVASADAAFHRAGFGGPLAKSINAVQPFTAAYLNSIEQTFRAFTGSALTGEKVFDAKTVGLNYMKAMAVLTVPVVAQWMQDRDKEWYKAAPDWQKDNGIFLHIGGDGVGEGHTIFFKYPPLISMLFAGIPRRLLEAYVADNPHALKNLAPSLGADLLPPGGLLTYNVLTPLIEHVANHSFFKGHALVDDDVKRSRLPPEQYNNYSTATSKAISRFVNDLPLLKDMNLSPPVIDNYIEHWGGTMGQAAIKATEMATGANPKAAAGSILDLPGFSSWTARYPSASAQPIQDFQDRMEKLAQAHGSLGELYRQGDLATFQSRVEANPLAANLHRFGMRGTVAPDHAQAYAAELALARKGVSITDLRQLVMAKKAVDNQRQFIRNVYDQDPKRYSPQDKRQIIDQAYAMMQVMAERGNAVLDKLGAE